MEVTSSIVRLAREGDLRSLFAEERRNLLVGDVAYLVVVVDDFAIRVADTAVSRLHQSIASLVLGANVAVNAAPAIVTLALAAVAHRSIFAAGQGAAHCMQQLASPYLFEKNRKLTRFEAVISSKPFGAIAFAIELVAVGILSACMSG